MQQLRCVKGIRLLQAGSDPAQRSLAIEHRHMVNREIYLLSNLQHPRIVRCEEYYEVDSHVYIVMEYASAGNLQALIDRQNDTAGCRRFDVYTIVRYFCDILCGLEYLHMRHVIHRDLKPENILVADDGRLKIADFGISKIHTTRLVCNMNKSEENATQLLLVS